MTQSDHCQQNKVFTGGQGEGPLPPPAAPSSDPPEENNPVRSTDKTRPATIGKKQSTEQMRPNNVESSVISNNNLNNNNNNSNSIQLLSNRRIEMPPAFLFPETPESTPDLIASRDDRQVRKLNKLSDVLHDC